MFNTATMLSYGMGKFLAEFLTGAFASLVFKFYETEIGLPAGIVAFAVVLYSVWNALNDPLIGYLTSRPTRLSSRLGRRFPWIVFGGVSSSLMFILVFSPPRGSTGLSALWLLLSICLYDALYSTWEVNYQSIFPDKFRDLRSRAKAAGLATLVGVLGVAGGAVLPTFVIKYGNPASYGRNAILFAALGSLAALFLIPGIRESKDMIERYLAQERARTKAASFKEQFVSAFASKNFLAFIVLYFFYQSATISMTASIHYVGDYVLGGSSTTLIFAGMLLGALAGVPLWSLARKKISSNQKLLLIATVSLAIFCLPLLFVRSHSGFVAAMFFWGIAFGGFWMLMTPAFADVVDEIVLIKGLRDDGVYIGFRAFAGRLAYAVQALSFWLVHASTGFASDPRSPEAIFGIRVHTALIPAVLLVIGAVAFRRMNSLDSESAERNAKELVARGL